MYATVGSAIACDRLRLYGNNSLCDRLRFAIRDRLRSSAIIWKPALSGLIRFLPRTKILLTRIHSLKKTFPKYVSTDLESVYSTYV